MYFKLVNKNDVCIQCSRWGIAQLRIFQRLLSLMMTFNISQNNGKKVRGLGISPRSAGQK